MKCRFEVKGQLVSSMLLKVISNICFNNKVIRPDLTSFKINIAVIMRLFGDFCFSIFRQIASLSQETLPNMAVM